MAEQKPRSLEEIMAAARSLFASKQALTIWDALELVLDDLTDAELSALYRRSGVPWCLDAMLQGTLVQSGIENLGRIMRSDPALRRQDDFRTYGRPSRPASKTRRRRARRRR